MPPFLLRLGAAAGAGLAAIGARALGSVRLARIAVAVLGLSALWQIWRFTRPGSSSWAQSDMLINFGDGPVRRGLGGEALIALSDLTGASPMALAAWILIAAAALTIGATLLLVGAMQDRPLLALPLLSPAVFVVFWANDAWYLQKEVFVWLVMVPLALLALRGGLAPRGTGALAGLVFGLAALWQVADALVMVNYCALAGAGDTRFTLLLFVGGSWLLQVPLTLFLVGYLGYGAVGAWVALTVEITIVSLISWARIRSKAWLEGRIGDEPVPVERMTEPDEELALGVA